MNGSWRGIALVLMLAAVWAPSAAAEPVPEGATWTEATIPSADGTKLHADVFRPKGVAEDAKVPVIVNIGPYSGTGPYNYLLAGGTDTTQPGPSVYPKELFGDGGLFDRGYAFVQADLRGFGGSEGCGDLLGPKERADAKAIVEWAASQPWSTGRVGTWGGSYEGWGALAPLAEGARGLAATVTRAPVVSLRRVLQEHAAGVYFQTYLLAPTLYMGLQADPQSPHAAPDRQLPNLRGLLDAPPCMADQLTGIHDQGDTQFWRSRDLVGGLAGTDVPVLFAHGFLDTTVAPDAMSVAWPVLGRSKRLWVGQFPHPWPYEAVSGREGFLSETFRFFDRHVAGLPRDEAPVHLDPKVTVQDSDGRWRAETAWPPRDAKRFTLNLNGGTYRAEARNFGDSANSGVEIPPSLNGVGLLSATEPLPHAVRFSGEPQVRATIGQAPAGAHLATLLYDVDPSGSAVLIESGASRLEGPGRVKVDLGPQDWRVPAGHRIAVLLTSTDDNWYFPGTGVGEVAVTKATLRLRVLSEPRTQFLEGGPGPGTFATRDPIQFDEQRLEQATVAGVPKRARRAGRRGR